MVSEQIKEMIMKFSKAVKVLIKFQINYLYQGQTVTSIINPIYKKKSLLPRQSPVVSKLNEKSIKEVVLKIQKSGERVT